MSGLFGIINLGLSALLAHRNALNTHSHNLANVNTLGYSRQEAVLTNNPALPAIGGRTASLVGGQFGTGVQVATVRRLHEAFLGLQSRIFGAALGRWSSTATPLREAEAILAPSPDDDLRSLLDRFRDAWESVANKPEDMALRYDLRETAITLTDTLRDTAQRLQSVRLSLDSGIQERVKEVNALAREIAEYNRQISVAYAENRGPNDLLDRRDVLLDRLSTLCGALAFNSEGGHLMVYLDGRPLIEGLASRPLSVASTAAGMVISSSYDGAVVDIANGEIGGLLSARDELIPGYLGQLDTLAAALVAEVNGRHSAGFGLDDVTGRDFLVAGSTAADIALDPAVLSDVRAIAAASAAGAPGDGSVALAIANLRTAQVVGSQSLGQVADSLLGTVAHDIADSDLQTRMHEAALDQIYQQQQSVAGVSTDEELAYLTLSQRAYEAAARVITTVDEMLRVIIERMGVS